MQSSKGKRVFNKKKNSEIEIKLNVDPEVLQKIEIHVHYYYKKGKYSGEEEKHQPEDIDLQCTEKVNWKSANLE